MLFTAIMDGNIHDAIAMLADEITIWLSITYIFNQSPCSTMARLKSTLETIMVKRLYTLQWI